MSADKLYFFSFWEGDSPYFPFSGSNLMVLLQTPVGNHFKGVPILLKRLFKGFLSFFKAFLRGSHPFLRPFHGIPILSLGWTYSVRFLLFCLRGLWRIPILLKGRFEGQCEGKIVFFFESLNRFRGSWNQESLGCLQCSTRGSWGELFQTGVLLRLL